jgi:ketosteroid isomerase-like protein
MPRENVDALRAVYEEWGRGNFRAALDLFDDDILFIQRPDFPEPGRLLGKDSIREGMLAFLGAWRDVTIAAEDFIEARDSVVVYTRWCGEGLESGARAEDRYFQVWTFRGPCVIRLEHFRERAEALNAVGLQD